MSDSRGRDDLQANMYDCPWAARYSLWLTHAHTPAHHTAQQLTSVTLRWAKATLGNISSHPFIKTCQTRSHHVTVTKRAMTCTRPQTRQPKEMPGNKPSYIKTYVDTWCNYYVIETLFCTSLICLCMYLLKSHVKQLNSQFSSILFGWIYLTYRFAPANVWAPHSYQWRSTFF